MVTVAALFVAIRNFILGLKHFIDTFIASSSGINWNCGGGVFGLAFIAITCFSKSILTEHWVIGGVNVEGLH